MAQTMHYLKLISGDDELFYRYYWLGLVEDVKNFCLTCDKCQRANRFVILFSAPCVTLH